MSEKLKKMNFVEGLLRKLRFCEWASPKMQQIIKQAGPSIQLLETVNFAFMKICNFLINLQNLSFLKGPLDGICIFQLSMMKFTDFLVKIVLFWAFLLFLGDSRHKLQLKIELGG